MDSSRFVQLNKNLRNYIFSFNNLLQQLQVKFINKKLRTDSELSFLELSILVKLFKLSNKYFSFYDLLEFISHKDLNIDENIVAKAIIDYFLIQNQELRGAKPETSFISIGDDLKLIRGLNVNQLHKVIERLNKFIKFNFDFIHNGDFYKNLISCAKFQDSPPNLSNPYFAALNMHKIEVYFRCVAINEFNGGYKEILKYFSTFKDHLAQIHINYNYADQHAESIGALISLNLNSLSDLYILPSNINQDILNLPERVKIHIKTNNFIENMQILFSKSEILTKIANRIIEITEVLFTESVEIREKCLNLLKTLENLEKVGLFFNQLEDVELPLVREAVLIINKKLKHLCLTVPIAIDEKIKIILDDLSDFKNLKYLKVFRGFRPEHQDFNIAGILDFQYNGNLPEAINMDLILKLILNNSNNYLSITCSKLEDLQNFINYLREKDCGRIVDRLKDLDLSICKLNSFGININVIDNLILKNSFDFRHFTTVNKINHLDIYNFEELNEEFIQAANNFNIRSIRISDFSSSDSFSMFLNNLHRLQGIRQVRLHHAVSTKIFTKDVISSLLAMPNLLFLKLKLVKTEDTDLETVTKLQEIPGVTIQSPKFFVRR